MKRTLLLTVLALLLARESQAVTVQFDSVAELSCGANPTCVLALPNSLLFESLLPGGSPLVLQYQQGGDSAEAPPATSASFGKIVFGCIGFCTSTDFGTWDLSGTSAVVNFLQSEPFVGSGALSGTFSSSSLGWIGTSGSSGAQTGFARLDWDSSSVAVVGSGETVVYSIFSPAVLLQDGENTIQGLVNVVPEPSSLVLLGSGLLGLHRMTKSRSPR